MMNKQVLKQVGDFDTEFEEKVLYINRCSKVVKGGRKFSFSALVLVGDGHGHIGFGFAKANEVSDAIRKATESAKKAIVTVEMEGATIPHDIVTGWDGVEVFLKPAPDGTGVIAGSKVRAVLELCGVKNIVAKTYGSNNPMNQVRAVFEALGNLRTKESILTERGIAC